MRALVDARRMRAADAGMWLFLASLVMFFASLFSGYVLLRTGSDAWTTPWRVAPDYWKLMAYPVMQTLLTVTLYTVIRRWQFGFPVGSGLRRSDFAWSPSLFAVISAVQWVGAASTMVYTGRGPATSVAAASWFVLTGAFTVGVLGGGLASGFWAWRYRGDAPPPHVLRQVQRYWNAMAACWCSILVGMYFL